MTVAAMASGFEMADGDTLLVSDTPHRPLIEEHAFRGAEVSIDANPTDNGSKY